jgi:transcriptional regulator with XRE-family HTH domain
MVKKMNRLKEIREDKDLYQKDIAYLLKIDQSNYSKYELEKINIPRDILEKLADYYQTSVDYILYRTDEKKPYPKSIIK